jgi:hypothetical protein
VNAGAAPKGAKHNAGVESLIVATPAEGLGRMSPPLSTPSVTVVIPVMNEANKTHSDPVAMNPVPMRSEVAVDSAAMRPRAPLDLIHSTSNAARVTTRARSFLS